MPGGRCNSPGYSVLVARIRLALCQLDTVVGDIEGNCRRVLGAMSDAEAQGADLIAFPELTTTGYPPEDLLLKPAFVQDNLRAVAAVAAASRSCAVFVGFVDVAGGPIRPLRNALAVCVGGQIAGVYHKRLLPNYGVFDEERWFAPGTSPLVLYEIAGVKIGASICEDLWFPDGTVAAQGRGGAELVVNINGSPYSMGRRQERLDLLRSRAAEAGCAIAYVNQVGGQDELVFDGASMVVSADGELLASAAQYSEELFVADFDLPEAALGNERERLPVIQLSSESRASAVLERSNPPQRAEALGCDAEVYEALVLGTRDYLKKNGFTDALVGLSGGIDSSLVTVVASDAMGPEHVHAIAMPSRYSSAGSVEDAKALASNLGVELTIVPIEEAHAAFSEMLEPVLGEPVSGLTDENMQSRIRGVILMGISNATGWIVLTTGNKSELATGFSTLYGDSAGGFAVIKDVPKTLVYRLCRYRNERDGVEVIPETVLSKAPSAELRPDQRDDQSLPPYDLLDPVLAALVEQDRSVEDLVASGSDPELVAQVARLVDLAEYKRRQTPPGVRVTSKAFGKDRRVPITNRYRGEPPSLDG